MKESAALSLVEQKGNQDRVIKELAQALQEILSELEVRIERETKQKVSKENNETIKNDRTRNSEPKIK